MQKSEIVQPAAMQAPFAIEGDKNIPSYEASGDETSSIKDGFLPITQEPLPTPDEPLNIGKPPERTDFNGMFYLSTDYRVFMQNGGFITFDAAVSAKIGGYPQDAILGYINNSGQYGFVKSLHNDNTADFVTTPSLINGTDWAYVPIVNTIETIKLIYPVGSLYIGTQSTCPLAALFGTWQLVAANKALWTGNGSNGNTSINAGLPGLTATSGGAGGHNHGGSTGSAGKHRHSSGTTTDNDDIGGYFTSGTKGESGDAINTEYVSAHTHTISSVANHTHTITLTPSVSNIYGKSKTVQPPAYVVNVWRRTA